MKNKYLYFFVTCLFMFSCKKITIENSKNQFVSDENIFNYLVNNYGFLPGTIEETPKGFIVEDDVFFDKENFWEKYSLPGNISGRHYRSQFKVTLSKVYVDFNTLPKSWRNAFKNALSKWNGLNLRIKFKEVVGYCPSNGITVQYASLGSGKSSTFARVHGFPTSNGNPSYMITVNSTCKISLNSSEKLKTAIHELGHALGFMHSDDKSGYMQIMTANIVCDSSNDENSVMRQGKKPFIDFSNCDKTVFTKIYRK